MTQDITRQIPATMRAFAIDRFGEPGSFRELPTPTIGADEMLVRVHAAGVNPIDWKVRDGFKAIEDVRFPFALGQDAAGVVVQVGPQVTQFAVGDEVYGGFWLAGAFAEYVRASTSAAVAPKPARLDFTHAAALPTPALAALTALEAVALKEGETVLIVGATGGVGSYVVQMAARRGTRVIATARSDAEAYVRTLGAVEVIDYTRSDVVAAVKAAYPKGIEAVVDVISDRAALLHMAETLRHGGRLATTVHSADEAALAARGIRATNVDVLGATHGLDEVARLVDTGVVAVPLERTFPLEEAAQALAVSQTGHVRGKIVLTVT
jgi:NADPH:quinone reductase-like Zn-dependent oxidoreductase